MAKTQRIKTLLNIGTDDIKHFAPHPAPIKEGDELALTAEQAKYVIEKGWAEAAGGAAPAATEGEEGAEEAESPLSDLTVADAIARIENMRSKEKLQEVIDSDTRKGVQDAAKKRLEALQ